MTALATPLGCPATVAGSATLVGHASLAWPAAALPGPATAAAGPATVARPAAVARHGAAVAGLAAAPGTILVAVLREADPYPAGASQAAADLDAAAGLPAWRAAEFLRSRTLLRWLAAQAAGPGTPPGLTGAPGRRPGLAGAPGFGASLSHTEGAVAAAVAAGLDVGVDVQAPVDAGPRLIARCCGTDAARLAALPPGPRARAFAAIWAVQEACVKAAGTGLAGAPWRIPVRLGQRDGRWREVRWSLLPTVGGMAVAVAARYPGGGRQAPEELTPVLLGPAFTGAACPGAGPASTAAAHPVTLGAADRASTAAADPWPAAATGQGPELDGAR